jgi:hypothetical protein
MHGTQVDASSSAERPAYLFKRRQTKSASIFTKIVTPPMRHASISKINFSSSESAKGPNSLMIISTSLSGSMCHGPPSRIAMAGTVGVGDAKICSSIPTDVHSLDERDNIESVSVESESTSAARL